MAKKGTPPKIELDERYLNVILDLGNHDVKAMVVGNPSSMLTFPQSVRIESHADYASRRTAFSNQPFLLQRSSVFQMATQPDTVGGYVVGEQAEMSGDAVRLRGMSKYQVGHIDVLMLAALMKYAPDGHSAVRVAIAYPPGAGMYADMIKSALVENCVPASAGSKAKIHRVTRLDGKEIEYRIKLVNVWEEPIGGLLCWVTRPYAAYNAIDANAGDKVALLDIGGGITSITPAILTMDGQFEVLSANAVWHQEGLLDVRTRLENELKTTHPTEFNQLNVPVDTLNKALLHGEARNYGTRYDVRPCVKNATAPFLSSIRRMFQTMRGGGSDVAFIICSGGGSGLMFEHLAERVFIEHARATDGNGQVAQNDMQIGALHLAGARANIQYANAQGAAYAFALALSEKDRAHA